jgi:hypothetical protein
VVFRILTCLSLLVAAAPARAAAIDPATAPAEPPQWEGVEQPDDEPNPFAKTYLRYELTRNYPVSFSERALAPGDPQPAVAYMHDLDRHWLMGLGGGYRLMAQRDLPTGPAPNRWLALFTIFHETDYVIRLAHPIYLLVGPQLLYILPADSGRLPLQRDKVYTMEIGGGLSAQLARVFEGGSMLTLKVDRWRGTSSQRLFGIEVAIGFGYAWR